MPRRWEADRIMRVAVWCVSVHAWGERGWELLLSLPCEEIQQPSTTRKEKEPRRGPMHRLHLKTSQANSEKMSAVCGASQFVAARWSWLRQERIWPVWKRILERFEWQGRLVGLGHNELRENKCWWWRNVLAGFGLAGDNQSKLWWTPKDEPWYT